MEPSLVPPKSRLNPGPKLNHTRQHAPRVGFGVPPERTLLRGALCVRELFLKRRVMEVRNGGTPLPTRETRMLPGNSRARFLQMDKSATLGKSGWQPGIGCYPLRLQMVAIAQW